LIQELKNATGLKFDYYQRNFLEKRIDFRMKHLNVENYQDYIKFIRSNPLEVDLFLDKFTINYTYFFRNLSVFQNFEKFITLYVKNLKNNKRTIKIWSAPCATGDEPYSLAMILDQLTKKNRNFPDFKIYASDIDTNAIKIASGGIYGEYAVHELPEHYLTTYFSKKITELGPTFSINSHIRKKVEFIQEDIITGHHHGNQKYDVIFCRNFFIYINQNARDDFLKIVEKKLYNGGLLVLGGSETIHRKFRVFKPISLKDRFYIKSSLNKNNSHEDDIYNAFNTKKRRRIKTPIRKVEKSLITKETIDKPKRIPKQLIRPKEKLEEGKSQISVREIQEKEASEVRITQMVVNNGSNGPLTKSKKNKISKSLKFPVEGEKNSSFNTREKALKRRELILQQKEHQIGEKIRDIEEQYSSLEEERKKTFELLKNVKEKETEVINRKLLLERITRQVEQREKIVTQRETQLEKRLNRIEQYSRQMIERERQLSRYSNEEEKELESTDSFEERRIDRIKNPNDGNELNIPKGYYSLINSFDKNERSTKMTINGLGAGIALILKDPINNIFAMSHISLPSSGASKQGYHLLFPHTFADTSVKDLYNNLIYNGGNKSSIKALIVGGAKLFLDYDMTFQENVDAIKRELELNQIEIEADDIGGLSERSVIYDTINDSLFVKKTWEFEFRKIT